MCLLSVIYLYIYMYYASKQLFRSTKMAHSPGQPRPD